MTKRLLLIDGDQGHFALSVEAGILTIGGNAHSAEAVLRNLRISRIRCEVEVEDDLVVVGNPESPTGTPLGLTPFRKELRPGEALQVGRSHLRLEGAAPPAGGSDTLAESEVLTGFSDDILTEGKPAEASGPAAAAPVAAATQAHLVKRLVVVDGADRGRFFPLPPTGTLTVGKSHKTCDIVLHDLYVSRVHCELHMEGDHVVVVHVEGDNGTLINGQRITRQELQVGEVLRVGNEHLRLETALVQDGATEADEEDEETIEVIEDGDDGEDEEGIEVIEDEEVVEVIEEEEGGEPFSLPHSPVDQLLKLEDQVLGNYQIGPLLGRGQSSLVFRAVDSRTNQTVALKVLSPDFPRTDAELQRFIKALKIIQQLQHPHLPVLYGAGKTGPYCWISREYIEGESLARLIQRLNAKGKFEWERACRIAIHLGNALDFLHQHRVTHGNITPRNILIRQSDKLTKLADLMLSRALEGSQLQKAILGKKLLTELPYLAPEQTDPHAPGTPLGDLYSLGAVLYALLTGQPPFTGASPREVVSRIREGKPAKPSKLQRGIPAPFEAAVLMMMARRPEDRFQTAADMLDAVKPLAEKHAIPV
jgi:serine/threonine-protein kinase